MRRWEVLYLTSEELSINAHQPTQLKKRPSHNQYQNSQPIATAFRLTTLGLAECRPPHGPRLGLHPITVYVFLPSISSLLSKCTILYLFLKFPNPGKRTTDKKKGLRLTEKGGIANKR